MPLTCTVTACGGTRRNFAALNSIDPKSSEDRAWEQAADFRKQAVRKTAFGNEAIRAVTEAFFFERRAIDFRVNNHTQARMCTSQFPGRLEAVETGIRKSR